MMDCGPAALTCLLGGFGVHVSYGRLREACQTDVDGTSIDALEDIANQLGLEAEQVMMPVDHVLLADDGALPALVVTRHPTGLSHFVVAWSRHGKYVQLMDPAVGRRWVRAERFQRDLYVHDFEVPQDAFEDWAASEAFTRPLGGRLAALGTDDATVRSLVEQATTEGWEALAGLDAAARMAATTGEALATPDRWDQIPDRFRFARPGTDGDVAIRGAVLVRALGVAPEPPAVADLSPELRAAVEEPRPRPTRLLLNLLRTVGGMRPAALAVVAVLAAIGVTAEALLVRGLVRTVELGGTPSVAALLALAVSLLVIEGWLASTALGLGRGLESHLRSSLLTRLPRLPERYFHSRPVSDLGERAHRLHLLRQLPPLGVELVRAAAEVLALTVAIAVVSPGSAVPAVLGAVAAVGSALAMQPALVERDLRLRNHSGATARFYLDGLLGLVALQAHSAEPVIEAEHGRLLEEWRSAARTVARTVVSAEAVQGVLGVVLTVWLVSGARGDAADPATFLLVAYWAMSLPVLGQRIGVLARQYPSYRNTTMRFLEPLSAPDEEWDADDSQPLAGAAGVEVRLDGVSVVAGGQTILADVDLHLAPGSRVAVVGPSGAGKSSLVGLLLGWNRAAAGRLLVDGEPLDEAHLARLRRHTAWVDPSVSVWNRSLAENLIYGTGRPAVDPAAVDEADLAPVMARLPGGLDEELGEGGGLLSGGEAQRVRLARALLRPDVRLAVLDEPFRGLDRTQRRKLLDRARVWWPAATLLFVTHDVGDTLTFDRVLVVDAGRVVEDGDPRVLAEREGSRYAVLLRAETEATSAFADGHWRRLWLEDGRAQVAELAP
jgi:ABC-type bacteriocin/lantibiotic exporter with double-glycine peptidase domain